MQKAHQLIIGVLNHFEAKLLPLNAYSWHCLTIVSPPEPIFTDGFVVVVVAEPVDVDVVSATLEHGRVETRGFGSRLSVADDDHWGKYVDWLFSCYLSQVWEALLEE